MVKRVTPTQRRSKHLCADAGYTGEPALKLIEQHGYIPHIKGRHQEQQVLKRDPNKKARRWVVEVAHSWLNRFRKLLVRYEVGVQLHRAESFGRCYHRIPQGAVKG